MDNIYDFMSDDTVIVNLALFSGFVQVLACSKYLNAPLSASCFAVIMAMIYACIAYVILLITPTVLKPLIFLVLAFSTIYYIFFKNACGPQITIKYIDVVAINKVNGESKNN